MWRETVTDKSLIELEAIIRSFHMSIFKKNKTKVTKVKRKIVYDEISNSLLDNMIQNRQSFEVVAVGGNMMKVVQMIEHAIERKGLRCRVYTVGRVAACGLSVWGGVTGAVSVVSMTAIAMHNLSTFNPDYEIGRDLVDNQLVVDFKKG